MGEAYEPEALWFGRTRSRCFGMVQRPEKPSNRGVVFCNTFGFDGLVAHRAFRHLANDLTDRGFWTLRFDYDGEGDSDGGQWEPNRLAAWMASIDDAVGVMRSRGVTDVRLVGFRFGASLAQLYASTHECISGVALWWPCVSGAAYVRELRALSRLSKAARPVQRVTSDRFPADSLEVCGFEFAAPSLAELESIELVAMPSAENAPATLLIERIDTAPNDLFLRKLIDSGSNIDHERMAGYAEFMIDDGVESVLPCAILRRISDWLAAAEVSEPRGRAPVAFGTVLETTTLAVGDPTAGRFPPPGPARVTVIEEPVWINHRLFAIRSGPASPTAVPRVSVVLCTTGANNRIGPGRLYVNLARYWASLGFTVIRVDLGGVGDSIGAAPGTENQPYAPIRIDELAETVAWVRRQTDDDEEVVVLGLCSGAFNAFHAAINGADINHAILVNSGMFYLGGDQTASTSTEARLGAAHSLSRGLMSPRKWRLVFREQGFVTSIKRARDRVREGAAHGLRFAVGAVVRNTARRVGLRVESASALPRDLERIIARGVKVLMIFSAGESTARYVRIFGGQAFEDLLQTDGLQLVEVDGGDHVFSSPGARQRLFEEATAYLEREYPLSPVGVATVAADPLRLSANEA